MNRATKERLASRQKVGSALLGFACALLIAETSEAQVSIADAPLFLVPEVAPNILYILDDSGSMNLSFLPDEICNLSGTNRAKSYSVNTLYYNPYVTYTPPLDHNGVSRGDAKFTAAKQNGYATSSATVDLSRDFRPTWGASNTGCTSPTTVGSAQRAYYYIYYEDHWDPSTRQQPPNRCTAGNRNDDDCYVP